jgi:hypothetical protein
MKCLCTLLILLLASCSGCAVMDDMMAGPEPHYPAANSCGLPTVNVSASQTAEPPR